MPLAGESAQSMSASICLPGKDQLLFRRTGGTCPPTRNVALRADDGDGEITVERCEARMNGRDKLELSPSVA